jgi:hypothetical protein
MRLSVLLPTSTAQFKVKDIDSHATSILPELSSANHKTGPSVQ